MRRDFWVIHLPRPRNTLRDVVNELMNVIILNQGIVPHQEQPYSQNLQK